MPVTSAFTDTPTQLRRDVERLRHDNSMLTEAVAEPDRKIARLERDALEFSESDDEDGAVAHINAKAKGSRAERRAIGMLEAAGYICTKAAGSLARMAS